MTVDTKGFVATPVKDPFLMMELVQSALDKLILEERKIEFPDARGWSAAVRERYQTVATSVNPSSGSATMQFTFRGAARQLTMHFHVDGDRSALTPWSINFSMGCYGESVLFVTAAVHALSMFGPGFVMACDSTDEFAPLQERPLSVRDAAALGYTCVLSLKRWVRLAETMISAPAERIAFLGFAPADLPDESYDALRDFVKAHPAPVLGFTEAFHERMALAT